MKNIEDAYNDALDYLYSFVDFSMQKAETYSSTRFKLERMQTLVDLLGNPQNASYPSIHVAGTKGKGSVCVLCATALKEAGYKVGLYTSPHLDDYVERIQINGEFIPHADFVEMVEKVKPFVAAVPELTTFEITTALAFMYFEQQHVDAAVIEVGLGGRLDATNVIRPVVSVITSISYDHTHLLGDTLPEIAGEKAGIIKHGIPVVCAPQVEEACKVIENVAADRGAPFIQVGLDVNYQAVSNSLDGQSFKVWVNDERRAAPLTLFIPFLGEHQIANAATAFSALDIYDQHGLSVDDEAIKRGFASAFWPGRFEIVQQMPPVILDCAHNRDSALKLRQALDQYFPGKPVTLVFGASEDKDINGMFIELMPRVQQLITVKSFHPRAIDPDKLVELAEPFGHPVLCVEHIPEAMSRAMQVVDSNGLVLVAGSIFVVAEARKYWEKQANIRRY
jgi:dihydrofolate synthase/folylpolyglutamate synthase